ncbi:MAG: sulfite exporter TauE/SafE family protein [SAR324 cluster bacterium]|nr:sulfite exporter TauE/SafE family protein [SAR324 cluster bacterium]
MTFSIIPEIELSVLLIVCLAFALGGLVKGIASFGLPMVTVPILSEAFSVPTALALTSIPILLSNAYLIARSGLFQVTVRRLWPLLICLAITLIFSTQLLVILKSDFLMSAVGLSLLLFVLSQFLNLHPNIPPRHEWWISSFIGILSGIIGGITSFFGVASLSYLVALNLTKERFIAAASTLLLTGGLVMAVMLAKLEVLSIREISISLFALIPLFTGLLLGQFLRGYISQKLFRYVVMGILTLLGISMIVKNIPF